MTASTIERWPRVKRNGPFSPGRKEAGVHPGLCDTPYQQDGCNLHPWLAQATVSSRALGLALRRTQQCGRGSDPIVGPFLAEGDR